MNIIDLEHFKTLSVDEKLLLLASTINDNGFLVEQYLTEQKVLKKQAFSLEKKTLL